MFVVAGKPLLSTEVFFLVVCESVAARARVCCLTSLFAIHRINSLHRERAYPISEPKPSAHAGSSVHTSHCDAVGRVYSFVIGGRTGRCSVVRRVFLRMCFYFLASSFFEMSCALCKNKPIRGLAATLGRGQLPRCAQTRLARDVVPSHPSLLHDDLRATPAVCVYSAQQQRLSM